MYNIYGRNIIYCSDQVTFSCDFSLSQLSTRTDYSESCSAQSYHSAFSPSRKVNAATDSILNAALFPTRPDTRHSIPYIFFAYCVLENCAVKYSVRESWRKIAKV